jgi:ferredoxin-NADP reductase
MLIQGLGLIILSAILWQALAWALRQRVEMEAVNQIARGELLYLRRLTEEAEARTAIHVEQTRQAWAGWRKFRVITIIQETEGVRSIYLAPHDRKPLPPFSPGQHIAVQAKIPGQRKPTIRCYSLSCAPNSEYYRISVKREVPRSDIPGLPPGLMSNYLHDALEEGDFIDLKSPSGNFWLDLSRHTPIVLIGGGIGITPVFSMLDSLVAQGSERDVWFFAGMRNRFEHPLSDQLKALADRSKNLRLCVCYSEPSSDCIPGDDYHHEGFVSIDLLRDKLPSNNFDFYFCGPPGMMNSLHDGLSDWGVPASHLHFEAFGPATVGNNADANPSENSHSSDSFRIKFLRSGKTLDWHPDDGSLLDLADLNGIAIESGCRAGNCGTCMTAVRTGEVRYRTPPGEMPNEGTCLLCAAVPQSDLELDA